MEFSNIHHSDMNCGSKRVFIANQKNKKKVISACIKVTSCLISLLQDLRGTNASSDTLLQEVGENSQI